MTPKKKATLPLASTLFCFISNIAGKQIPSLRQIVSLLREYKCYTFIYVTCLHIQDTQYDSITLYTGKISCKIFVWNQVSLFKGTHDLYFELIFHEVSWMRSWT